jgi:very-short-patch-repair endonuclease
MHGLSPELVDWLSTHHGVIGSDDLERLGVSRERRQLLRRTGVLQSYVPGVYRLGGAPRSTEQAAALACAAGPDVIVSHTSAGRHWGFRQLGADAQLELHVLIAGQNHRRLPDAIVHRSHLIEPIDIVEGADGIRYTSPPRTVFDLASVLNDDRLESVIEQVLHDGLMTIPTLRATGARLRQRGRDGSARFGRVIESRPAWLRPVDSDLELRVERAIIEAGLPRPLRQYPVQLPSGETFRLDFYWPDNREALEVDHITWHGGRFEATADKRRDRLLRQLGIHTTRITDDDVRNRLPVVIVDLRVIVGRSDVPRVS